MSDCKFQCPHCLWVGTTSGMTTHDHQRLCPNCMLPFNSRWERVYE